MNPTADFKGRGALAAREAAQIVAQGGRAIDVACDLADEAQVATAVDRVMAEFSCLDMAFNNADTQVPASDAADELAENVERVVKGGMPVADGFRAH